MSSYTVTSSWVNVILCIYGLVSHKCPTHDGRQQKGMGESGLADGLFQFYSSGRLAGALARHYKAFGSRIEGYQVSGTFPRVSLMFLFKKA